MAVVAILLGFCTAAVHAAPAIVETRTAASTVLVVVLQTETLEPDGGTGPDALDLTLANWRVNGLSPTAIHRYSIPWDENRVIWSEPTPSYPVTTRHRIYLRLSSALVSNQNYSITTPYGNTNFVFHSRTTFCESIKVNQVGYSKLGTSRFANFGVYMGNGGSLTFNPLPSYEVINSSGAVVASGTAVYMGDETVADPSNPSAHSGEHVYRLSLNAVPEGGPYYVSVVGAGRSRSFGIGSVYSAQIANTILRGMYHHRCGLALTHQHTPFAHAICHTNVYDVRSTSPQDQVDVPDWSGGAPPMFIQGGYHDAGDMDHPETHPIISILMFSFFEAFPNRFTDCQYNIPESGNGIPDFLDEIMWGVRMWEYLQVWNPSDLEYGGVRSGWSTDGVTTYGYHNAANDPLLYGTKNVQEDCTAMVAGVFAQASRAIRPYNVPYADSLLNRAQMAWNYLAAHYNVNQAKTRYLYAALQLYLATGTSTYHNIFQSAANSLIVTGGQPWPEVYWPGNFEATCQTAHFVSYLLNHGQPIDAVLVQNLKNKILFYADNGTYMGPPPENEPYPQGVTRFLGWGSGTAQGRYADVWIYGTLFTTDPVKLTKYTNAVCQYADFPLGLNAMNMSYYTGLGVDRPNSPLDCNSYFTKYGTNDGVTRKSDGSLDNFRDGNGNPIGNVPGIVIFGPADNRSFYGFQLAVSQKMSPAWESLPPQRRFGHGHTLANQNEFTVTETMAWNIPMYAFLSTTNSSAWQAAPDGIGTRVGHSTVFTGTEVIIWGGGRQSVFLNDGARYNLANNTWTPISQVGAPAGRWHHAAVWTGTEMIVWGGRASFYAVNHFNNGAAYNPASNTWRPISSFGAPVGRSHMAAVWTGSEILVWAGVGDSDVELGDGARYNVATDSWGSLGGPPLEARHEPSAVWTGTEMIVFGGLKYDPAVANWFTFGDGARYNPANSTWTLLNSVGAPSSRTAATALWTGTEMLIWGGRFLPNYTVLNTGARYNPANNTWTPISTVNAPQARLYHAEAWTGSEMIIWGGQINSSGTAVNTGGIYSPTCDKWTATSLTGVPTPRFFGRMDCGIWTGNSGMFIYGGWGPYPWELNSAALYKRAP